MHHDSPYTLLVAVVLSAQATDKGVNRATGPLFRVADTPEKMLALGEDGLRDHIKTIGLFNAKARNIIRLSRQLIERHGGRVPDDPAMLGALAGVGQKTADVVLNIAFGHPTIAVDTHVFRVSNRLGIVRTGTPEKTRAPLLAATPATFRRRAHHWLILHGRYICTARRPACDRCLLADLCPSRQTAGPAGADGAADRASARPVRK